MLGKICENLSDKYLPKKVPNYCSNMYPPKFRPFPSIVLTVIFGTIFQILRLGGVPLGSFGKIPMEGFLVRQAVNYRHPGLQCVRVVGLQLQSTMVRAPLKVHPYSSRTL